MGLLTLFWGGSNSLGARVTRRVTWVLLALGLGTALTFANRAGVFFLLLVPAGGQLSPFEGGLPVVHSPLAPLRSIFGFALTVGIVFALPVATASGMTLFKPLMPRRLWLFLLAFIPVTYACFIVGAAFAYYVIVPRGLTFLLGFGDGIAVPLITLSEYIGLLTSMMFALGLVFETPPAMYLSARMGVMSYRHFRKYRRLFLMAAAVMSAIISPGFDTITMLMVFIPMAAMFEVGLFVTWLVKPEEGNYLFLGTIGRGLRKVRRGVVWVVRRPVVVWRRVERKLVEHGLVPWW